MGDYLDNLTHDVYIPELDDDEDDFLEKHHAELTKGLETDQPHLKTMRKQMNKTAKKFIGALNSGNNRGIRRFRKKIKELEGGYGVTIKVMEPDINTNEAHRDIMADPNDSLFEAILDERI